VRGPVEIALFTDHVQAATSFYERLVGVTTEAEWPGGAIFATGGVQLLVHERPGAIEGGPPNEDHVAFGVPNSPRQDGAVAPQAAASGCWQRVVGAHASVVGCRGWPR